MGRYLELYVSVNSIVTKPLYKRWTILEIGIRDNRGSRSWYVPWYASRQIERLTEQVTKLNVSMSDEASFHLCIDCN